MHCKVILQQIHELKIHFQVHSGSEAWESSSADDKKKLTPNAFPTVFCFSKEVKKGKKVSLSKSIWLNMQKFFWNSRCKSISQWSYHQKNCLYLNILTILFVHTNDNYLDIVGEHQRCLSIS